MTRGGYVQDTDVIRAVLDNAPKAVVSSYLKSLTSNKGKPPLPIGAQNLQALEHAAKETKTSVDALPRYSLSKAAILWSEQWDALLFVRVFKTRDSDHYRRANRAALKLMFNTDLASLKDHGTAVDHVASESSLKNLDCMYSLVLPIDAAVNSSYGSIEPVLSNPPDSFGLIRPNALQILKICGIPVSVPKHGDPGAGVAEAVAQARKRGIIPGGGAEKRLLADALETADRVKKALKSSDG